MLEFGIALRPLVSDLSQPIFQQIEETASLLGFIGRLGVFDAVRAQHHWLSYPSAWIEPIPLLARLAPEAGHMKLMTSVMKPPIHNPVDLAHQIATIDNISAGKFIFGVGLGYQEEELEAVGASRKIRVSRFEESIELMKRLWSGEEVTFEGRYWSVHSVRMGYTPVQKPHPPIWNASYSIGATRRAAKICDGLLVAPQASWDAVSLHAKEYFKALREYGKRSGRLAVNRTISVARTYEDAEKAAREKVAEAAVDYGRWGMQESATIDMVLDPERDPRDWAIVGTPQDCVEAILKYKAEIGFDFIGPSFANLPKDPTARRDYLQYIAEEVFSKVRQ